MIEFCKVNLAYGGTQVLSDINCILGHGEFTCVIGKNGSGKSTLLRAAAGLLPYSGSILLHGAEMRGLPRQQRARHISYLPQSRTVPHADVETLISYGRYPHLGFSKTLTAGDQAHVANAAVLTGVTELLHRNISELSGGERQRAYIAMMVAQGADIMLLDEPAAHLDIAHQLEFMELLKTLHQSGKSIVMAAHDLPQALSYATRVLLVADGGIAAAGTPDEMCNNPALKRMFGVMLIKTNEPEELYAYKMIKGE